MLRRQAYELDGAGFFCATAVAWVKRSSAIVAGEPYDESRWIRLRSGASVPRGTYGDLIRPDKGDIDPSDEVGDEEDTFEAP